MNEISVVVTVQQKRWLLGNGWAFGPELLSRRGLHSPGFSQRFEFRRTPGRMALKTGRRHEAKEVRCPPRLRLETSLHCHFHATKISYPRRPEDWQPGGFLSGRPLCGGLGTPAVLPGGGFVIYLFFSSFFFFRCLYYAG